MECTRCDSFPSVCIVSFCASWTNLCACKTRKRLSTPSRSLVRRYLAVVLHVFCVFRVRFFLYIYTYIYIFNAHVRMMFRGRARDALAILFIRAYLLNILLHCFAQSRRSRVVSMHTQIRFSFPIWAARISIENNARFSLHTASAFPFRHLNLFRKPYSDGFNFPKIKNII